MNNRVRLINRIIRSFLLPKEFIGFFNGIITSIYASILIANDISICTKIIMSAVEILIIALSIALLKYRNNFDENRRTKNEGEAWTSINNELLTNKVLWLLPKQGILLFNSLIAIALLLGGYHYMSENNKNKLEQQKTQSTISNIHVLVNSMNSTLQQQHLKNDSILKIDIINLGEKIDSLVMQNQLIIHSLNPGNK